MQLESLHYYLEVLKAESITGATDKVFISQQGLSKAIRSIEKEFNVDLLRRSSTGKMMPTDAGREFAIAAQSILETWDSLKNQMAHYSEDGSSTEQIGPIKILVTPYLANTLTFLFDQHEFQKQFSEEVIVLENNYETICSVLRESPIDTLALINICPSVFKNVSEENVFTFDPIIDMHIMLKCSPDFLAGKKKSVTLEEVRSLPLALYKDAMLTTVLQSLFDDERLSVLMRTTNKAQIGKVVARGDAATFTDTFVQTALNRNHQEQPHPEEYVCVPIEDDTRFSVGFLSVRGVERSLNCLHYESFCKNYVKMKYDLYLKKYPVDANAFHSEDSQNQDTRAARLFPFKNNYPITPWSGSDIY